MKNSCTFSIQSFTSIVAAILIGLFISPDLLAKSAKKTMLRFGMLSDVHYANREPAGDRFYRQSIPKMKEAVDQMNRGKVDFIIELGDFKDQDAIPNEANTLKYLTDIETTFQKFNGPTYHVLGNHDMDGFSKLQFLERVENLGITKTKSYYSFNRKGLHLVVLDGNFSKDGNAYDHGNYSWEDANIPDKEIDWLTNDLKQNKLPVIVFIHQMLDDSKNMKQAIQNAAEVRQILERSGNVLGVFQGHVHEERYNRINGIHYYSVNAMVDGDGLENSASMIVTVNKDRSLTIEGFRRASDREIKP